jgi:hypothetical protein
MFLPPLSLVFHPEPPESSAMCPPINAPWAANDRLLLAIVGTYLF